MGSRGNFEFNFDRPGNPVSRGSIFLYTHSMGHNKEKDLREALSTSAARNRWGDPMYLARILISQIVGDDNYSEYGWGIGPYPGEEEFEPIKVLLEQDKVVIGNRELTFEEFVSSVD